MTTTVEIVPGTTNHRIDYLATLLSPLHHGAGTSGNTARLRTQEVIQPDGTIAHVPFLSAASIRHALRDRLAWHLADTIGLEAGSLSKLAVDLLWSGGAVTTTGAEVNLELARRVEEVFPALAMFGYAAQSDIVAGTLRASDAILVCAENQSRLPDRADPALAQHRAAHYRGDEFGARHDVASTPVARLVDVADTLLGGTKTTQMIFETQILKTGSQLAGTVWLTPAATEQHRAVLGAAIELWAPAGETHLGAKTATGYGHARIDGLGDHASDLAAWTAHVEQHADQIVGLIQEMTGK